jgi:hypothetical protein
MISLPVLPPVSPGHGEPPERDRVDRVFTEIVSRLIAEEPGWAAPAARPRRVRPTPRRVVAVVAAGRGDDRPAPPRIAPRPLPRARLGARPALPRERSPPPRPLRTLGRSPRRPC